jgi:hypothetical protein
MTRLPQRFVEDRELRDAARAVLTDDIDRLRATLGEQGIASRVSSGVTTTVTDRMRAGARDVLAQARAQASDQKGVLALLLGALILFFARGPILDWLEEYDLPEDEDAPDAAPALEPGEGDVA